MTTGSTLDAFARVVASYHAGAAGDHDAAKMCCADVYGIDLVGLLLGDSYHPGGVELTRRLAAALHLEPGQQVLDIGSGLGTTALVVAADHDVDVLGIDLGPTQVTKATARATAAGLAGRVHFRVGDAEQLPLPDGAFDAVLSECAFCTFPDKPTAACEAARVLRPGGRLGLTDVWLNPASLDPELAGLAGRIACIADARPMQDTRTLLDNAGLRVDEIERDDDALATTVELIRNRLRALRLLDLPILRNVDLRRAITISAKVSHVIDRGDAGYFLLTATKSDR
jgi:SAM-dependent methyltransferase